MEIKTTTKLVSKGKRATFQGMSKEMQEGIMNTLKGELTLHSFDTKDRLLSEVKKTENFARCCFNDLQAELVTEYLMSFDNQEMRLFIVNNWNIF